MKFLKKQKALVKGSDLADSSRVCCLSVSPSVILPKATASSHPWSSLLQLDAFHCLLSAAICISKVTPFVSHLHRPPLTSVLEKTFLPPLPAAFCPEDLDKVHLNLKRRLFHFRVHFNVRNPTCHLNLSSICV